MAEIKKVPKKLRDGPVIAVDLQILLWRARMAKAAEKGTHLGKGAKFRAKVNKEAREKRAELTAQRNDGKNKKWFE